MSGVLIRPYAEGDRAEVIALWQACGLTRPQNDPDTDIELKLAKDPELFLVAEDQGRVVGSVMGGWDGHRGHVNYLGVHPGRQRQGLGKALMQALEGRLKALGCPKLNLEVRVGNQAAADLYAYLGYTDNACLSLGKRI
jgi:ribosomal protein S18 acetylase RimI-like enzyme